MTCTETIVELADRSYPIYTGQNTLSDFSASFLRHNKSKRAAIITDTHVRPLYADILKTSLDQAAVSTQIITIPAGETSKSIDQLSTLYDQLMTLHLERADAVIALGGGVVGDLAGFAAATFKRGIQFVQVPTTLLAMVDSSVGGKTGINHPGGKNMIGSFYQPSMVFADVAVLKTLPPRELGCGLAESVKHGAIQDADFFDFLELHRRRILNLDLDILCQTVVRNCRIKAAVVSQDEREAGLRRILNYGHTIGHPFESALPDHPYHHGEAVSLGIIGENRLAVAAATLSASDADRIESLLRAFHLPVRTSLNLPVKQLYQGMAHDKKVKNNRIVFAIPDRIGHCEIYDNFSESAVVEAITALMQE